MLCLARRQDIVHEYFSNLRDYNEAASRETVAANSIQRLLRGARARHFLHVHVRAIKTIQRAVRGWFGRRTAQCRSVQVKSENEKEFFDAVATEIQRIYRGYESRKLHDYFGQKRYINSVKNKGNEVVEASADECRRLLKKTMDSMSPERKKKKNTTAPEIFNHSSHEKAKLSRDINCKSSFRQKSTSPTKRQLPFPPPPPHNFDVPPRPRIGSEIR
eukprot:GHVL01003670.1.p1 GENE.GHVL01003670.1~~GHVL01003670.1.p1  ORF type:complete len:217 (-),score=41.84 GHVL01003670.1:154-804(-)